jgi:hypothetical protein
VPPEDVVNALHRIHAALVPGGVIVDTQPVSPDPPVTAGGAELGRLDMREWRALIDEIDGLTLQAGLFAVEAEREIVVTDTYDGGPELVEIVGGWKGTRIPGELAARLAGESGVAGVHQDVRVRILRAA